MKHFFMGGLVLLLLGFVIGQQLPNTFLQHPIATAMLMRTLPPGVRVAQRAGVRVNDPFYDLNLGEYGIVIGYESVLDIDGKSILLCLIRTEKGTGPLIAVNPVRLTRLERRG